MDPIGSCPAKVAEAKPPTEAELRLTFPAAAKAAEQASEPPTEGKPFLDRIWTRAQGLVTLREGDHVIVGDDAVGPLRRTFSSTPTPSGPTSTPPGTGIRSLRLRLGVRP